MFLKSEVTTICLFAVKHLSYHSVDLSQPAHVRSTYLKISQWFFRLHRSVTTNSGLGGEGCRFKEGPFCIVSTNVI